MIGVVGLVVFANSVVGVLGMSSVFGIVGVSSVFGVFCLAGVAIVAVAWVRGVARDFVLFDFTDLSYLYPRFAFCRF